MQLPIIPPEYQQFLTRRNLLVFLFTAIILISLPIGLYLVQNRQNLFSKAASSAISIQEGAVNGIITSSTVKLKICPPEGCTGGSGNIPSGTPSCSVSAKCSANSTSCTFDTKLSFGNNENTSYYVSLYPDMITSKDSAPYPNPDSENGPVISGWMAPPPSHTYTEKTRYLVHVDFGIGPDPKSVPRPANSEVQGICSAEAFATPGADSSDPTCFDNTGRAGGCQCSKSSQCGSYECEGITGGFGTCAALKGECDKATGRGEGCPCNLDSQCAGNIVDDKYGDCRFVNVNQESKKDGKGEGPDNIYSNRCTNTPRVAATQKGCTITGAKDYVRVGTSMELSAEYSSDWRSNDKYSNKVQWYERDPVTGGARRIKNPNDHGNSSEEECTPGDSAIGTWASVGSGTGINATDSCSSVHSGVPETSVKWTAKKSGKTNIEAHLFVYYRGGSCDSCADLSLKSHAYCTTGEIETGTGPGPYESGGSCTKSTDRPDGCDCNTSSECSSGSSCNQGTCDPIKK